MLDDMFNFERCNHFACAQGTPMLSQAFRSFEGPAIVRLGKIKFPQPRDININMMPYVIGDKTSIPKEYRHYYDLVAICEQQNSRIGEIGYLTINEGEIQKGKTQRRPGLHIERISMQDVKQVISNTKQRIRTKDLKSSDNSQPWDDNQIEKMCGFGPAFGGPQYGAVGLNGGLFMSSSLSNTCRVWNMRLHEPGKLGSIEHLRDTLGESELLEANELVWITDATPHEALPQEKTQYRQWFRVIIGKLGMWFMEHNTKNALGILPDCPIVKGSKFQQTGYVIS